MSQHALHDLLPMLPDHPCVRAVLWHLAGLRQKGMEPELWLTERERAEVSGFGHERRKREWMAARIALKRLLVLEGVVRSPLHAEIRKNGFGQPRIVIYVPESGHYQELACSLAHKNHLVMAAFTRQRIRIGIDIERRSWRLPYLRRHFESERDLLLPGHDPIARYTLLWAFKEAASKWLGRGFACGFSQIVCRETRYGVCEIEGPDNMMLQGFYGWTERYAATVVTDVLADPLQEQSPLPAAPDRPWYKQVARARRLRQLRRARALSQLPPDLCGEAVTEESSEA